MSRRQQVHDKLISLRDDIAESLGRAGVVILPPMDISESARLLSAAGLHFQCCIFDPWYNKGVGGIRDDYEHYLIRLLSELGPLTDHLFVWGFPEIVARFVPSLPRPLELRCWLTWYYKNSPSRIRGWRSAQMTCLHLTTPNAAMHVENFLNDIQKEKLAQGKLQYIPGPPSVIEESLLCGFVGRSEQTGHPSQKPVAVIEKLILMATARGELVIDLMSGSGTTGEACQFNERYAILCDISEEYTSIAEERLGISRLKIKPDVAAYALEVPSGIPMKRIHLPDAPPAPPGRLRKNGKSQLDFGMK